MKINEVEKITSLSSKTIRMYEEKGLLKVERNSNSYREYDDNAVKKLNEIRLFRKLDIQIAQIKRFYENEIEINELLSEKIKQYNESENQLAKQKALCETLIKDYKSEKKDNVVNEYLEAFDYMETEEYSELENKMKDIGRGNWAFQILITLTLIAPVLWIFINLNEGNYDLLKYNIIVALISTVILTVEWVFFIQMRIKYKNKNKKEHTFLVLFSLLVALFLTFFLFFIIDKIQYWLFVPKDYLAYGMSYIGIFSILFFELEIIAFIFNLLRSKLNINYIDDIFSVVISIIPKKIVTPIVVSLNIIAILLIFTSLITVTNENIRVFSMKNFSWEEYEYTQIQKVETGYFSKGRRTGEFYYKVTMDDGKRINLIDCAQKEEIKLKDGSIVKADEINTYLWIKIVDQYIMDNNVEKVTDEQYKTNKYNYDQIYIDLFNEIINNK